jgi:hypothetical protein
VGAPLIGLYTTLARTGSVILVDLSCTGAKVRGERLPDEGDELILSVEGLKAFGTVAWIQPGECGIRFDLALDGAEVRAVQKKVPRGFTPEMKAALDDWNLGVAR